MKLFFPASAPEVCVHRQQSLITTDPRFELAKLQSLTTEPRFELAELQSSYIKELELNVRSETVDSDARERSRELLEEAKDDTKWAVLVQLIKDENELKVKVYDMERTLALMYAAWGRAIEIERFEKVKFYHRNELEERLHQLKDGIPRASYPVEFEDERPSGPSVPLSKEEEELEARLVEERLPSVPTHGLPSVEERLPSPSDEELAERLRRLKDGAPRIVESVSPVPLSEEELETLLVEEPIPTSLPYIRNGTSEDFTTEETSRHPTVSEFDEIMTRRVDVPCDELLNRLLISRGGNLRHMAYELRIYPFQNEDMQWAIRLLRSRVDVSKDERFSDEYDEYDEYHDNVRRHVESKVGPSSGGYDIVRVYSANMEVEHALREYGFDFDDRSKGALMKLTSCMETGASPFDVMLRLDKMNTFLHLRNPLSYNLSLGERAEICKDNILELRYRLKSSTKKLQALREAYGRDGFSSGGGDATPRIPFIVKYILKRARKIVESEREFSEGEGVEYKEAIERARNELDATLTEIRRTVGSEVDDGETEDIKKLNDYEEILRELNGELYPKLFAKTKRLDSQVSDRIARLDMEIEELKNQEKEREDDTGFFKRQIDELIRNRTYIKSENSTMVQYANDCFEQRFRQKAKLEADIDKTRVTFHEKLQKRRELRKEMKKLHAGMTVDDANVYDKLFAKCKEIRAINYHSYNAYKGQCETQISLVRQKLAICDRITNAVLLSNETLAELAENRYQKDVVDKKLLASVKAAKRYKSQKEVMMLPPPTRGGVGPDAAVNGANDSLDATMSKQDEDSRTDLQHTSEDYMADVIRVMVGERSILGANGAQAMDMGLVQKSSNDLATEITGVEEQLAEARVKVGEMKGSSEEDRLQTEGKIELLEKRRNALLLRQSGMITKLRDVRRKYHDVVQKARLLKERLLRTHELNASLAKADKDNKVATKELVERHVRQLSLYKGHVAQLKSLLRRGKTTQNDLAVAEADLKRLNATFEVRLADLQHKNDDIAKELMAEKVKVERLDREFTGLQLVLSGERAARIRLNDELTRANETVSALQLSLTKTSKEHQDVRKELQHRIDEALVIVDTLTKKAEEYETILKDKDNRINNQSLQLALLRRTALKGQTEFESLQKKHAQVEKTLGIKTLACELQTRLLEQVTNELDELQRNNVPVTEELEKRFESLTNKLKLSETDKTKLTERLAAVEKAADKAKADTEQYEKAITEARNKIEALQTQKTKTDSELQTAYASLSDTVGERDMLQNRIEESTVKLKESENTVIELTRQLLLFGTTSEGIETQLSTEQETAERLRVELRESKMEHGRLVLAETVSKGRIEKLTARVRSVEAKELESRKKADEDSRILKNQLTASLAKCGKLERDIIKLQSLGTTENDELVKTVAGLQAELLESKRIDGLRQKQVTVLRATVSRLESQNNIMTNELGAVRTDVVVKTRDIELLKDSLSVTKMALIVANAEIERKDADNVRLKEDLKKREERITGLDIQCGALETKFKKADEESRKTSEALLEAKVKLAEKALEIADANKQTDDYRQKLVLAYNELVEQNEILKTQAYINANVFKEQLSAANSELLGAKIYVEGLHKHIKYLEDTATETATGVSEGVAALKLDMQRVIDANNERIKALETENKRLNDKVNAAVEIERKYHEHMEAKRQKEVALQEVITRVQSEFDKSQDELSGLKKDVARYEDTFQSQNNFLVALRNELVAEKNNLVQERMKLAASENAQKELSAKLSIAIKDHEIETSRLRDVIANGKVVGDNLRQQLVQAGSTIEGLTATVQRLENDKNERNKQMTELHGAYIACGVNLQSTKTTYESELRNANAKIAHAERKHNELITRIGADSERLSERDVLLRDTIAERVHLKNELDNLTQQYLASIGEKELEMATLTSQLDAARSSIANREARIRQKDSEIATLNGVLQGCQALIEENATKMEVYERDINVKTARVEELQGLCHSFINWVVQSTGAVVDTAITLETATQMYADYVNRGITDDRDRYKNDLDECRRKLQKAETELGMSVGRWADPRNLRKRT